MKLKVRNNEALTGAFDLHRNYLCKEPGSHYQGIKDKSMFVYINSYGDMCEPIRAPSDNISYYFNADRIPAVLTREYEP